MVLLVMARRRSAVGCIRPYNFFVQPPVLWARPVMWECPTVKLYTLLQIYNYYIRTTIQMLGGSLRDTVVWQSGHWLTMEKELFLVFTL